MTLQDRHAVITGGGSGIGAAAAARLAGLGARVTLLGRDPARLEARAASLLAAFTVAADITDEAAVARAFAAARERFGPVHVLINNAGRAASAPFARMELALWQEIVAVNLTGAFLCARAAVPDMLEAGWGRIVNVSSIAGLRGGAYIAAYCAAKHGLVGMTRALAVEVGTRGVTVNAVCPGYTDTELVDRAVDNIAGKTGRSADEARAGLAASNPGGRMITPEEVAAAIAWLCLPESAAINGAALPIAGGEV